MNDCYDVGDNDVMVYLTKIDLISTTIRYLCNEEGEAFVLT